MFLAFSIVSDMVAVNRDQRRFPANVTAAREKTHFPESGRVGCDFPPH